MPFLRFAVFVALVAVPACGQDEAWDARSQDIQCPPNACGNNGNSPVIDGVYFWRLNRDHLPNDQGVRITSVEKSNGVAMRLATLGDRLVGLSLVGNTILAEHTGLHGTRIFVSVNGKPYRILIDYPERYTVPFMIEAPTHDRVEAYKFTYTPANVPVTVPGTPLCQLIDESPGHAQLRALVFAGDKYDPVTKTVEWESPFNGWMTIACEASAPWKMHLVGHTTGAAMHLSNVPISTSIAQRQAMLNAWTMNACGKGPAFTCQGVPLSLTMVPENWLPATSPYQPDAATREAIWGPHGALCLDTHRLSTSGEDAKLRRAEIADQCGELPPCDATIAASPEALVITGVPTWPPDPKNLPSCP